MTANDRYQAAWNRANGWAWTTDDLGSARRDAMDNGDEVFAAKVKALEDEAQENYEKFSAEAEALKSAAEKEQQDELDAAIAGIRRAQK